MQAFFCICICICCTDDKKKVPLAAAAAMQGVFVGRGRAGVGKKIAPVLPGQEAKGKRQENTAAPKFNPDQCKKVSPRQSRQETLQNKQKMTSKKTDRELIAKVQLEEPSSAILGNKLVEILIFIPTSLTSFQLQCYIRGWGYLGIPETCQQAQLGVC